jgi:hypothetical protein
MSLKATGMPLNYSLVLHLIAGVIAGSVFKVRTLVLILCCIIVEFTVAAAFWNGNFAMAVIASLAVVQAGYAGGLLTRFMIERSLGRTATARTHRTR